MSKTLPLARITIAVLEDINGPAHPPGDRADRDARRVPSEGVKAFWEKLRRHTR